MRRTLNEDEWSVAEVGYNDAVRNYHTDVTNWVQSFGVPLFFSRYTGIAETVDQ
jgi:hypothetical protein